MQPSSKWVPNNHEQGDSKWPYKILSTSFYCAEVKNALCYDYVDHYGPLQAMKREDLILLNSTLLWKFPEGTLQFFTYLYSHCESSKQLSHVFYLSIFYHQSIPNFNGVYQVHTYNLLNFLSHMQSWGSQAQPCRQAKRAGMPNPWSRLTTLLPLIHTLHSQIKLLQHF